MKKISIFDVLKIIGWDGVNVNISNKYVILKQTDGIINMFGGEGNTEENAWDDASEYINDDELEEYECYEVFIPYKNQLVVTVISEHPFPDKAEDGLVLNWDKIV